MSGAAWDDFHVEFEEYRELDGEGVLVLNNRSGRGKTSGVELQGAKGAELLHIRHGRITKAIWYWNRDRALADLGLTPRTPPGNTTRRRDDDVYYVHRK